MLINPIEQGFTFFLNAFQALPAPVQYFTGLSIALIIISALVSMIFRG